MATLFREALLTPSQPVKRPAPDVFQNLLLTTLAVAAVVTPFHQTDWPNPSRVIPKPQFDSPNLTVKLPVAPPFSQSAWPNPKPLVRPPPFDAPNLTQRLPVAPPFKQSDWPNPTRSPDLRTDVVQNIAVRSSVPAPFYQTAWPNPPTTKALVVCDQQNLLGTTLAQVGAKPFSQYDWATPKVSVLTQQSDYQNLLTSTLAFIGPMPFSQTNWPNPPFVRQSPDLLSITQSSFFIPPFVDIPQGGGGIQRKQYSPRRAKKEYAFLKEIQEDLLQEMQEIEAESEALLTPETKSQLLQNVAAIEKKYAQVKKLDQTYQTSLDTIDQALLFIDMRINLLMEDEMMFVIALIVGMDDS